jgi:Gram-negative bacterial TonB protein C-terminal
VAGLHAGPTLPARFARPPDPDSYYPYSEKVQGHQALYQVDLQIDSLGNPRFAHVARFVGPSGPEAFSEASVRLVREARWLPASSGGQPVTAWKGIKVKYLFGAHDRMGNILSDEKLDKYVAQARHGDLNAQMVVSYLDGVASSEVGIPVAESIHYLAQSALAGERSAELRVAQALSPISCTKPPAVQKLLHDQAWHGFSAAELLLAGELLESDDPAADHDISVLLHGAANSKDPFVQLWATGILATAPRTEIRDPAFALTSAQSLKATSDPDVLEALAAAEAANGQYDAAVMTEDEALKRAAKVHWNDTQLRVRRAAYQAGQAWVGYLCDCTQLVPGEGL